MKPPEVININYYNYGVTVYDLYSTYLYWFDFC